MELYYVINANSSKIIETAFTKSAAIRIALRLRRKYKAEYSIAKVADLIFLK